MESAGFKSGPYVKALLLMLLVAGTLNPARISTDEGLTLALEPVASVVVREEYGKLIEREPVPPVRPMQSPELPRDLARKINAAMPFSAKPNPAAEPFHLRAQGDDRTRAIDCLAAAMWYEAGADPEGQRAVAQVVLNRARHPAFPKSICGVVFQGSQRETGCQFTFTCDGAMRRIPPAAAWRETRARAVKLLEGGVFSAVGLATHYHTDWVAPWWHREMEKIVAVQTHLFFRWPGRWGTRIAYQADVGRTEPVVPALAHLSDAHGGDAPGGNAVAASLAGDERVGVVRLALSETPDFGGFERIRRPVRGGTLVLADRANGTFVVSLNAQAPPGNYALGALDLCSGGANCKVMGWINPSRLPRSLPVSPASERHVSFVYLRRNGQEYTRWDCSRITRPSPDDCIVAGSWNTVS